MDISMDPCRTIYDAVNTIRALLACEKVLLQYDQELPEAIQELHRTILEYLEKEREELLEIRDYYLATR